MISRITLFTAAVALLGLVPGRVQAQGSPQYSTVSAGCLGDQACADARCTSCADVGCADGWLSPGLFGRQHHPNCCCPLCHPRHAWASFDALMWWGKGRTVPPLVTSGANGALPDATIAFGGGTVGGGMAPGARADFGFWFDECETLGMGAKVWGLHGDSEGSYLSSPDGSTVLARPFYNIVLDQEDSFLVSSPGLIAGGVTADTSSSVLSAEAYLRSSVLAGRGYNLDLVGGYHFLRLDDDLSVFSSSVSIDPAGAVAIGTLIDVLDEFGAKNEFHGGTVGLSGEIRHGKWTVSGLAKFSVGNMHQSLHINGSQVITAPSDVPAVWPGGILAQPTNMGSSYSRDVTAWIPEFSITAGYDVRNWLRLTAGYNFLWISNVALSGDQVDRVVNTTQFHGNPLIGEARPAAFDDFNNTEYWLHGLTLGLTILY
ncbi:MAG: BBP7 family outer membrane beta-barrel protein [Planctomycetaceae bacterium]|nr:BBP7 family outer membrane beta-barrel protein [Planctomycetaceae bacterium]